MCLRSLSSSGTSVSPVSGSFPQVKGMWGFESWRFQIYVHIYRVQPELSAKKKKMRIQNNHGCGGVLLCLFQKYLQYYLPPPTEFSSTFIHETVSVKFWIWVWMCLEFLMWLGGGSFRIVLKKRNKRSHPGRRGYFENICLLEKGYCKIHEWGSVWNWSVERTMCSLDKDGPRDQKVITEIF